MDERIRGDHFAGHAIDDVQIAVAIRPEQHLERPASDRQIDQHVFVDAVVVLQVVRARLVEPDRVSVIGSTREDAARPFVRTRALLRIPRSRIRSAVIDEIELRVVGNPAPHRTAADLPCFRRPRPDTEVRGAVLRIEGLERGANPHVLVGSGAVGAPHLLAGARIECGQPAAHAELPATVAD